MDKTFGHKIGGGNATPHGSHNVGGSASMGVEGGATGGKVWAPQIGMKKGNLGVDIQGPNAMLGGISHEGTTEIGAQANLIGGGVTYDGPSRAGRFGVGLGWGGGVRSHQGDMQGFGVDAGPFSMDYKSKTFNDTLTKVGNSMDPTKNPLAMF